MGKKEGKEPQRIIEQDVAVRVNSVLAAMEKLHEEYSQQDPYRMMWEELFARLTDLRDKNAVPAVEEVEEVVEDEAEDEDLGKVEAIEPIKKGGFGQRRGRLEDDDLLG